MGGRGGEPNEPEGPPIRLLFPPFFPRPHVSGIFLPFLPPLSKSAENRKGVGSTSGYNFPLSALVRGKKRRREIVFLKKFRGLFSTVCCTEVWSSNVLMERLLKRESPCIRCGGKIWPHAYALCLASMSICTTTQVLEKGTVM